MDAELSRVIAASRDGKACPIVIHQRPRRIARRGRARRARDRQHPMQVLPGRTWIAASGAAIEGRVLLNRGSGLAQAKSKTRLSH